MTSAPPDGGGIPLPRRSRPEPLAPSTTTGARNAERIGSPSRPPEEIRNILSRYRSGLQSGRAQRATDADGAIDEAPVDDAGQTHE
jgi:hypothetical protein